VAEERFARPDHLVTGQVLKLLSANSGCDPDRASGPPRRCRNPVRDRGYKGLIYQTHGAASMDFIRIAGNREGVIMSSGP